MINGATKNYKFGQKNNWRRTLWNEIFRRTGGREKQELILYLAGPQDLDRIVAEQKGAPTNNLIAIDRSAQNVTSIRSSGHSAINADALDTLRAWPENRPVCAVVLDFCSGLLNDDEMSLLTGLMLVHPSLKNAVFAVNFMRGRDGHRVAKYLLDLVGQAEDHSVAMKLGLISPLHRGLAFTKAIALQVAKLLVANGHVFDSAASDRLFRYLSPKWFSYRSSTLVFDSVVLSPLNLNTAVAGGLDALWPKDAATARKISATLAIRTRRALA